MDGDAPDMWHGRLARALCWMHGRGARATLLLGMIALIGCASSRKTPRADEPVGLQLLRVEPGLRDQRFNALLTFEQPTDRVFVDTGKSSAQITESRPHTGRYLLELPAGTLRVAIKLTSIVITRPFPGEWALAGTYLYPQHDTDITIAYELHGRAITIRKMRLAARKWNAAMVDLSPLLDPNSPADPHEVGFLVVEFQPDSAGSPVWLDDVILVDNSRTLVDAAGVWSIEQRGFRITGQAPGRFNFSLQTPEAVGANGWRVEEANEIRARFASNGKTKSLTVYNDGRAYRDGVFKPMGSLGSYQEILAAQHAEPAELSVSPEETARIEPDTPGDANHDGYNELEGAYHVAVTGGGAIIHVKLTPRTSAIVQPVIVVDDLPQGEVLVTVEGQRVEQVVRLADGSVLAQIPVRIQRPTTITFHVK